MVDKRYIGSTTYVSDASRLTDTYGYNGDVAYVIDEFTKKVLSEYTKFNGHWTKVQTGSSGGGGNAVLENDLPVTAHIQGSGIPIGRTYLAGTDLETIFRDLLNPVAYPTIANPSCTISTTSPTIMEKGSTTTVTIKAVFSRGKINPAYGTNGYRSGSVKNYSLNGKTPQTSNTFNNITVNENDNRYIVTAYYDAGEQPKDSAGNDYLSPLPAGNVSSDAIEFEFVDAWWANTSNASIVEKQALISKKIKEHIVNFPATDENSPETFDVPESWTITNIEIYNDLTSKWQDCSSEFKKTTVTHTNSIGETVTYNRYTCTLPYDMAARAIKVKWS